MTWGSACSRVLAVELALESCYCWICSGGSNLLKGRQPTDESWSLSSWEAAWLLMSRALSALGSLMRNPEHQRANHNVFSQSSKQPSQQRRFCHLGLETMPMPRPWMIIKSRRMRTGLNSQHFAAAKVSRKQSQMSNSRYAHDPPGPEAEVNLGRPLS